MISNERPSPYGHRPRYGGGSGGGAPKRSLPEETLRTEKIQVERKTFILTLKENSRGRFVRITEDVHGRRDTIIVPATGLADFRKAIEELIQVSEANPPKPEEQS